MLVRISDSVTNCYLLYQFGCARTTSDPKNVVTCIRFLSFSITIAPSSSSANCKKGYTLTEKEALINELEQELTI